VESDRGGKYGHVEVVTTLVELDIGALTAPGETTLQVSIRCGQYHVARVLRELERSARTKKEAEAKKPTQQAIEQAERMAALVIEEEEREQAQRKVRGCSTLTLAELDGTRLDGVFIAHGERIMTCSGGWRSHHRESSRWAKARARLAAAERVAGRPPRRRGGEQRAG
jgi:hypothetical protein